MSLRDGNAKMSKSDPSRHEPDQPRRRRRRDRPEDPQGEDRCRAAARQRRRRSTGRPEALNLVTIYAALTDRTPQSVLDGICRQGLRRLQAGAGRPAGRDARADPRAARRISRPTRPRSRRSWPTGAAQGGRAGRADARRRLSRARTAALNQDLRWLRPQRFMQRSAAFCDKGQVVLYSGQSWFTHELSTRSERPVIMSFRKKMLALAAPVALLALSACTTGLPHPGPALPGDARAAGPELRHPGRRSGEQWRPRILPICRAWSAST